MSSSVADPERSRRVTRLRRLILALVGLGVSAAALLLLGQLVDAQATLELLGRTDPLPILVALIVLAAQLVLRSIRWSYLLPSDAGARVRPVGLLPVLLVGYLSNIVLPARLGEIVRAYLVTRREPVALSVSLGVVFLERVLDLASLAVVGFAAASLAGAAAWMITGTALVAAAALAIVAFLVIVGIGRVVSWGESLLGSGSSIVTRVGAVLGRFGQGAGEQPRSTIALAFAISVTCWLLDGTTFWLMARAISADLDWGTCLLMAAITTLGTAIPSAPGYVGTYELAAVAAGTAVGVPADVSFAVALLAHAVTAIPLVLGGIASLIGMSVSFDRMVDEAVAQQQAASTPPQDP
jgi:uncharacterized protein (TIRG00374 family)